MAHEPTDPTPDDDLGLVVELTLDESDVAVVRIAGELDIATADLVRDATERAVAVGVQRLVFDLAAIDFIDSSGITVLLEAVSKCTSVAVRHPSEPARRIIETTGLSGVLGIEP